MTTSATDRDLAAAVDYIHQHACEGLAVERLVKETQWVSQPVFVRRFRAATGQTPRAAILRRQLEEARRLLAGTELSPAFIAEHCGFRSLAALERALQAAEGNSAIEFRQQSRPVSDGPSVSPPPGLQTGMVRSTTECLSQNGQLIPPMTGN